MKIGFIGAGNMGGAILKGILASGSMAAQNIFITDSDGEKVKNFQDTLGVQSLDNGRKIGEICDIIIIGVKPDNFQDVLLDLKDVYNNNKTIISMAAGVSIKYIEGFLGSGAKIIRIMPNTPALVNAAMVAVCRNVNINDEEFNRVFGIFNSIGIAKEIDEKLIHCVIGVSGSSPAYTYMYIEALAQAAEDNGMEKDEAVIFAAQAVLGAAKMVLETGIDPVQLRLNVCSKGGTTIEAVNKLQENGFEANVKEGFQAAVDKSILMEK